MTTRLNFHIGNGHTPAYESFQVESVQSSPSSTQRRSRTASGASSLPSSTFGDIEFTSRRKRQHSRSSSVASSLDFDYSDDGYYRYNHDEGEDTDHTDTEHEYASNERLLLIAFFTFMSFSVTQLYFAFRAQSEAMKGDSAAMMVDSLTYLFNFCAERAKHNVELPLRDTLTQSTSIKVLSKHQQERNKRKRVLQLEILPPLISVTTLLIVTAVVLRDSLRVIWWDLAAQHSLNYHVQGDPNIELMLMFALINLGLDVVNFGCFARASHLFGYDTSDIAGSERHAHTHRSLLPQHGSGDDDNNDNNNYALNASEWRHEMDEMNGDSGHDDEEYDDDEEDSEGEDDHRPHANLNMCSAYTHVFADTLRSVAVIIAAGLAELFDDVTAEEADAAAALVVSLLIVLSLVPLSQGLYTSLGALWAIRAEERSEAMMEEIKHEERKRRDRFWSAGQPDWS